MCRIFMIVFSLCLFTAHANAASVQWPVSAGGNGHYYEAVCVPDGINWTNANAAATAMGGYLATITSAEENAFVFSLVDDDRYWRISHQDISGPWIGGYQDKYAPEYIEPVGGWKWITGELFTFTNWYPGEPDNSGDQEALSFYGNGATVADRTPMWDDAYHGSDANVSFVVEFNAVPEPSTFVLLGIGIIASLAFTWRRRMS
jgi:hypothetical protein